MTVTTQKKRKDVAKVPGELSPPRSESGSAKRAEGPAAPRKKDGLTPQEAADCVPYLQSQVRSLFARCDELQRSLEILQVIHRKGARHMAEPVQGTLEVGVLAEPQEVCRLMFLRSDRLYTYFKPVPAPGTKSGPGFAGQLALSNYWVQQTFGGAEPSSVELSVTLAKKGEQ